MVNYISAITGQVVRLVVETLGNDGYRADDGYVPVVTSVIFPDLSLSIGYPAAMMRLDTGLYVSGLQIPTGADAIGTYIATVFWLDVNNNPNYETYAINAARPFGISSVSPI
jgi:hypothetical protein